LGSNILNQPPLLAVDFLKYDTFRDRRPQCFQSAATFLAGLSKYGSFFDRLNLRLSPQYFQSAATVFGIWSCVAVSSLSLSGPRNAFYSGCFRAEVRLQRKMVQIRLRINGVISTKE